jgi:hypothetical protein
MPALAAVESGAPAVVSTPAPATSTTLSGPLAKLEPALEPVQRALEQGRLGPAREQVERWLAGRPDSPVVGGAQYLRGRIAQRQGDTATARRAFDKRKIRHALDRQRMVMNPEPDDQASC